MNTIQSASWALNCTCLNIFTISHVTERFPFAHIRFSICTYCFCQEHFCVYELFYEWMIVVFKCCWLDLPHILVLFKVKIFFIAFGHTCIVRQIHIWDIFATRYTPRQTGTNTVGIYINIQQVVITHLYMTIRKMLPFVCKMRCTRGIYSITFCQQMEVGLYLPVYRRSFRGGNSIFSPWRLSRLWPNSSYIGDSKINLLWSRVWNGK